MKKRGLSEVITTLIMVLLVIVALGIVWIVIRNVIQDSSEGITVEQLKINAEIRSALIDNSSGNASITIKRNRGESNPTGFLLIFSDGTQSEQFKIYEVVNELETKTFYVQLQNLSASEIKTVSIASIHSSDSGKESFSNVLDEYKIKQGTVSIPTNNQTQNNSQNNSQNGTQNLTTYYLDSDGDGFGNLTQTIQDASTTPPSGYVSDSTDCHDANANINPSATEQVLNNGIDEDCDGTDWTINGLIGYWRFENNAADSSGNSKNGVSVGTTIFQTGKIGSSANFSGSNFVRITNIVPINGNSYTKVAWIKRNGDNTYNIMSGAGGGAGGHAFWAPVGYNFQLSGGHNFAWEQVRNNGNSLILNQWYHVALTYDGSTNSMRLYQNGNLIDTGTTTNQADDELQIGAYSNQFWWQGNIDEVMIFNRSLTTQEIQEIYNNQN